MSSALLPNILYCINKTRSFLKVLNGQGPSIDTCGSHKKAVFVVLVLFLITTFDFLINSSLELKNASFAKPYVLSFASNESWYRVSKVFIFGAAWDRAYLVPFLTKSLFFT